MKKIGLLLMVFSLLWIYQPAQAQESVEDAYKFGERCLKKIRNRRFRKFNESYTQALKDMDRLQKEAAEKKFGYESLIEKIPDWIKLNDLLRKFDSESISNKGETITFEIKDYKKVLEDAKLKSAKARFEAGKKMIASYSNYDKSKDALEHFKKAKSYSGEFNEEINKQKGILCYKAGVEYSNSDDIDKVEKSREFFECAKKQNPEYKDVEAELKKLDEKGAEVMYNMAMEKEKEKSFRAQIEAAEIYERIGKEWVKDYKDADEKAKAARERSTVDVYFLGKDGKVLEDPKIFDNHDIINTPKAPPELRNLDLTKEENFVKAVEIAGEGFVLAKPGESFGSMEYIPTKSTKRKEEHEAYVQIEYDDNGKIKAREEITEKEYKVAKKISSMGDQDTYEIKKVTGTVTITTKRNGMKLLCPLEIWDLRKPRSPMRLGEVDVGDSKTFYVKSSNYKGAKEPKPDNLSKSAIYKSERRKMATKEELKKYMLKYDSSVEGRIDDKSDSLNKELPKLIKYREI